MVKDEFEAAALGTDQILKSSAAVVAIVFLARIQGNVPASHSGSSQVRLEAAGAIDSRWVRLDGSA